MLCGPCFLLASLYSCGALSAGEQTLITEGQGCPAVRAVNDRRAVLRQSPRRAVSSPALPPAELGWRLLALPLTRCHWGRRCLICTRRLHLHGWLLRLRLPWLSLQACWVCRAEGHLEPVAWCLCSCQLPPGRAARVSIELGRKAWLGTILWLTLPVHLLRGRRYGVPWIPLAREGLCCAWWPW